MTMKPRTDEDRDAIKEAMAQLRVAELENNKADFRATLEEVGLGLLLRRHLFRCDSFEHFHHWLAGDDRGAQDVRKLVGEYGLREKAAQIVSSLRLEYADQDRFDLEKERAAGEGGSSNEGVKKTLEWGGLSCMLYDHLFRSASFDEFFAWFGSEDHAAQDLRGMITKYGLRAKASSLVSTWRKRYARNQFLFEEHKAERRGEIF